MRFPRFLLLAAAAALAGCMSIPIATMAKMASFDDEDFLAIKPEEFRTKVQFDRDLEVDLDQTVFKLDLVTAKGEFTRKAAFVVMERHDLKPEKAWYSLGFEPENEVVLALNEAGQTAFREVQGHIRAKTIKGIAVTLKVRPKFAQAAEQDVQMTVQLLLNPKDGYFTMFDAMDVHNEMDKVKQGKSEEAKPAQG